MEELEEELKDWDCNPIGRTTVSINLDPSEFPETKSKAKELVCGPRNSCSRALPCMAYVWEDALKCEIFMPQGREMLVGVRWR